jgi:hypothetical protein
MKRIALLSAIAIAAIGAASTAFAGGDCACADAPPAMETRTLQVTCCYTPILSEFQGSRSQAIVVMNPRSGAVIETLMVSAAFYRAADENWCGMIEEGYVICKGEGGQGWYKYQSTMAGNHHKGLYSVASNDLPKGSRAMVPSLPGELGKRTFVVDDTGAQFDIWLGYGEAAHRMCRRISSRSRTVHFEP